VEISKIFTLPSLEAAPLLLGCILERQTPTGLVRVKIVETEAYHQDDPASHSFRGNTLRTAPMFKEGGHIYVYFTYGMHYCINIVTGQEGTGEAVLIRAAEPLLGTEIMQQNRGLKDIQNLTNGPAKLCQALGINNTSISGRKLGLQTINLLSPADVIYPQSIVTAPRVGIRQAVDLPWRFYLKNNHFVSKI
jgi:DNA-3-methyladenine glycosylase